MKDEETHRNYTPLETEAFVACPLKMPEMVHMDDPATYVFTDFSHNRPAYIAPHVLIDDAMNKMKKSGIRLMLVINEVKQENGKRKGTVIGQITACDLLGDAPIKLAQSTGTRHSEMTVDMLMTPRKDIKVVEWPHIKTAQVGHIIATMHDRECCHILVVDKDKLRGIFSMSEISRHLGHNYSEPLVCAHSLADLVHRIA